MPRGCRRGEGWQARRGAVALLTTGLLLAGAAIAGCGPAPARRGAPGPGIANGAASRAAAGPPAPGSKLVEYGGYRIDVPASWPVYELAAQPHRCVRYDRHAVYLGYPGPDQRCPAHLVGRTETVLIDGGGPGSSAVDGMGSGGRDRLAGPGAWRLTGRRAVSRYLAGHELFLTTGAAGLSITATYAADPAVVARVIASVRARPGLVWPAAAWSSAVVPPLVVPPLVGPPLVGPPPVVGPSAAVPGAAGARGAATAGAAAPAVEPVMAQRRRPLRASPRAGPAWPGRTGGRPLAGFDTCTAPSVAAMRAWRAAYSAAGIYIGGANQACDDGNLSARWVRRVKAMGWYLIPTYVGLQPPCDRFFSRIRPGRAGVEGRAAADDAVTRAHRLGLRRGAPIYFDMEAYNSKRNRCRTAVLTFLDAWTRRLRARGYLSGVYSSAASGAEDLGRIGAIAGHPLAKPRSIWFALWDGRANVLGTPYVRSSWWPPPRRIKQFRASRWQRHGRFRLNIDRDQVSGPVY